MIRVLDTVKSSISPFLEQEDKQGLNHYRGFRILTDQEHLMPDFIIVGAQRCGTTSLYNYMTQHPRVIPALRKEVHFFNRHFGKGIDWYRSHFPSFSQEYKQNNITGEATPYYIFHPLAPKRIFAIIPQVRLIVLLRNPTDRAYSHYQHEVRLERESLYFEEAIEREWERLYGETEKILKNENYSSFNHQNYSYLGRGIYVDQLKIWMSLFPKENILILKSEDLYSNPPAILNQVFEFFNLPNWELNEYKKYNYANYPKMSAITKKGLNDYFAPHNRRLYEYLGVNLGWNIQ